MTLGVYKDAAQTAISADNSYSNPIKFEQSTLGGSNEQRFYLKSDTPTTEYFTSINLSVIDTTGSNETSWVTFALDLNGAPVSYSGTLDTSLALNEQKYFWIKVENPAQNTIETKTDVRILVKYIRITV